MVGQHPLAGLHAHYRHCHEQETAAYHMWQQDKHSHLAKSAYLAAHERTYDVWLAILAAEQHAQQPELIAA